MSTTDTDSSLVRFGRVIRDNPLIPLIVFLLLLVAILEVLRPGIVMPVRAGRDGLISTFWVGNLIKLVDIRLHREFREGRKFTKHLPGGGGKPQHIKGRWLQAMGNIADIVDNPV